MSDQAPLSMRHVALLYVASGLPFGVINQLVPAWLTVQGADLKQIGLASLIGLPWVAKPLWAPAVDWLGHPGRWVRVSLVIIALGLVAVPWLPLRAAGLVLLVVAAAAATQDIAIDGLTAASVPKDLQGRANGVRVAAYRAAMLVAGGGAVALADYQSWKVVFLLLGGLSILLALISTLVPDLPLAPASGEDWSSTLRSWTTALAGWIWRPSTLPLVAFVLLFKLGDSAMSQMVSPFWIKSGLSLSELGLMSTSVGAGLTVLGAVLGGEIVTKFGLYRSLWPLGGFAAITNLGYAAAALSPTRASIYAASVGESLGQGLGTAAYLAALMRLCEGEQTATRFAALTALAGLTRMLAGVVSGAGSERFGFSGWFAITFLLALPAFFLLPFVRRRLEA